MAFEKLPTKCKITIQHLSSGKSWNSPIRNIENGDDLQNIQDFCRAMVNQKFSHVQFNIENSPKLEIYFPIGILQECIINLQEVSD